MIPEFAILGHPNEGKSSVLSTLAEDDSVRVSSTPGETTECRTFPVTIDGQEILRFVDTPGFQNPRRLLKELHSSDNTYDFFQQFIKENNDNPAFSDDCELLRPIVEGAGIIYVVDASRPLRNIDKAEMEILRLSGKPRMAVMNCKGDDSTHLTQWKNELQKSFNSTRIFNAHRATYGERIRLLETLKSIDQDWQQALEKVVDTFKKDWSERNRRTVDIFCKMLRHCLTYRVSCPAPRETRMKSAEEKLHLQYTTHIKQVETKAHEQIRALFKHNIFNYTLPQYSILHEDLFNEKTWNFLGLDKKQMAIVGGLGGAALAAGLDLAVGGASLGLFTTLGGALGAAGALYGGKSLSSKAKFLGIGLGDEKLHLGPNENIQFLFILMDRTLLYYSHIINWAHGRRDYEDRDENSSPPVPTEMRSFSNKLPLSSLKVCHDYYKAISGGNEAKITTAEMQLKEILKATLLEISHGE